MEQRRNEAGFSLVEMLIALGIFCVLMTLVVTVVVTVQDQFGAITSATSTELNARPLVEQVGSELRSARGLGDCEAILADANFGQIYNAYDTPWQDCQAVGQYNGQPVANVAPAGPVVQATPTSLWFYSFTQEGQGADQPGAVAPSAGDPPALVNVCVDYAAAKTTKVTGISEAVPVIENRYAAQSGTTYTNATWSGPVGGVMQDPVSLPTTCELDKSLVAPTGEHLVIGYLVGIKLAANTTVTDPCNYTLFSFYDASGDNVTPTTCTGDVADAEGVAAVNMSATFGIKAALLNSKTGAFSYIASARVPSASINVQVFSSIAAVRYQSDEQWSER